MGNKLLNTNFDSETYLASIVTNSSDAIIGKTLSGIVTSWNPAAEKLYGYSANEIIGKSISLIYPKELKKELRKILRKINNDEKIESYETIRKRKDSSLIHVSISVSPIKNLAGEIIGCSDITRDITEKKRMEEALRESEHKFKKLIDSNILGVIISDTNGSIYEANSRFQEIVGYSFNELTKMVWQQLTPEKWYADDALAIEQIIHYGEAVPREKEYIRKDGVVIPVLIGTTLLDKEKMKCLTFVLDISEQKELERRKDDFISIASHELKTPITSIKVFTQLLQRKFDKLNDAPTTSLIVKMDTQINKLINLISDLLDVSRIESGKLAFRLEKFFLNEVVEENIEALRATTNHSFVYHNGVPIEVFGDRERIGQVITNFLTNAIKYSPPEKEIIVSLKKKDANFVQVSVKDFGVGISDEEKQHIFERFYQARNSHLQTYPGLGMGLFISSEIVKRHGGTIWVESEKDRGSNFFFTIPLQNFLD